MLIMFYKLAFHNVRKSFRDYIIYFLTLTFGVCLFYVFNSMDSQSEMLDITSGQHDILIVLSRVMEVVSVFISVILGFLVLYANQYLMKRRKKEFGIYLSLGMKKQRVSFILVCETFLIGIVALTVGLIIGVFASQGLSVVTAKLLETSIKRFYFTFSQAACIKTIVYFGVIFILVMLFNTLIVSRLKLIDLMNGAKKNEVLKVQHIGLSVVIFIISLICLGFAYYFIIENGLVELDWRLIASLILGSIGTFLFFMSLSGFLLKLVQMKKSVYLRGLNMFVLRQINSKIRTTFISMTIICLMLLIAIGTLSCGMAAADAMTGSIEEASPYNASFSNLEMKQDQETIENLLRQAGVDLDSYIEKGATVHGYQTEEFTYGVVTKTVSDEIKSKSSYIGGIKDSPIKVVPLSEYNNCLELLGQKPITLKDNEYAASCTNDDMMPVMEDVVEQSTKVQLKGETLKLGYHTLLNYSLENATLAVDIGTIIVPDRFVDSLHLQTEAYNVMYKKSVKDCEDKFVQMIENTFEDKETPYWSFSTREGLKEGGMGIRTVAAYFVLYIGIIFLITCAAILAIQQLSEASDNVERYKLLNKLGVESEMMTHSLFIQILIYFLMPLLLALVHSYVAVRVASNVIKVFGHFDILNSIIFTGFVVVLVYGTYFILTYVVSKNIIKSK